MASTGIATGSARRPWFALAGFLVVLGAGMAVSSLRAPFRNGVDVPATIFARNGEHAGVRFVTRTGAVTTTTVHICHHQAYALGGMIVVRYDPDQPIHAVERDMAPSTPDLGVPIGMIVAGILLAAGTRSRLHPQPADQGVDIDAALAE